MKSTWTVGGNSPEETTQAEREWLAIHSHMIRIKADTRKIRERGYIPCAGLIDKLCAPVLDLEQRIDELKNSLPFVAQQTEIARFNDLADIFEDSLSRARNIHEKVRKILGNESLEGFVSGMCALESQRLPALYILTGEERSYYKLFTNYQDALAHMELAGEGLADYLRKVLESHRDRTHPNTESLPFDLVGELEPDKTKHDAREYCARVLLHVWNTGEHGGKRKSAKYVFGEAKRGLRPSDDIHYARTLQKKWGLATGGIVVLAAEYHAAQSGGKHKKSDGMERPETMREAAKKSRANERKKMGAEGKRRGGRKR